VIFQLPDDGRNPHLVPHSPGASEPSSPEAVGSDAPAAAVEPSAPQQYLVPERIVSQDGRKSEIRTRHITEAGVLECMDLQGDAENDRRGLIPTFVAYKQTQAWLKSKGGFA
jgi:hypothetical protein